MAMMPKRVKFRKSQRGRVKGHATRGNAVVFGDFGLQAIEAGWLRANVLEAARVAAVRGVPEGRVYIRVFPHKSVTSTPEETRMGTGKGEPDYWCAVVRPGTMLFEIGGGVSEEAAKETLGHVAHKLPLKARFVRRRAKQ
jgi:large subunit ribosomal protein L16